MARTVDEVEQLRGTWSALPVLDVDADIDYFLTLVRHDPHVVRPHVLRLSTGNGSDVLMVGRVVRESQPFQLGWLRLGQFASTTLVVSFGGVVGSADDAVLAALGGSLRDALKRREFDAVRFQQVETEAGLRSPLKHAFPWWQRAHGVPVVVRWKAVLPESWTAFLAERPSRSRRQIRSDDSKFTRKYAGRFEVRRLDRTAHLDRLDDDLEHVARLSYQRALGVGTDASVRQRALRAEAVRRGWLRVWMLYVDDRPVAFWWGLAYGGVFTVGSPAYDPSFAKDRVGYFTMRRMIEDLCADPAVAVLDFGHGDADYKARFGTLATTSSDVLLFAPTARGLVLNGAVSLTAWAGTTLRRLVERSGRAQEIKRAWRARRTASRLEV